MSNFELVHKYGASVFVVHKFLEENKYATFIDIQVETGLSDGCLTKCVNTLLSEKLIKRERMFLNKCRGYRYTTIQ